MGVAVGKAGGGVKVGEGVSVCDRVIEHALIIKSINISDIFFFMIACRYGLVGK
jgi:hypothetical protein